MHVGGCWRAGGEEGRLRAREEVSAGWGALSAAVGWARVRGRLRYHPGTTCAPLGRCAAAPPCGFPTRSCPPGPKPARGRLWGDGLGGAHASPFPPLPRPPSHVCDCTSPPPSTVPSRVRFIPPRFYVRTQEARSESTRLRMCPCGPRTGASVSIHTCDSACVCLGVHVFACVHPCCVTCAQSGPVCVCVSGCIRVCGVGLTLHLCNLCGFGELFGVQTRRRPP